MPKELTVKTALQSAANATRLIADSMKSLARIPEQASESPPAGEEDLLLLWRLHGVMKRTSELLASVDGCNDDSQDEINREFSIVRRCLEQHSYLKGPPTNPEEY